MQQKTPIELCIPKVSQNITKKTIFESFKRMNIGYISRISENPLRSDPNYKRIVVKIFWDNTQELAKEIQEKLQNPNEHINLVYDMPWYWQIYANHPQK